MSQSPLAIESMRVKFALLIETILLLLLERRKQLSNLIFLDSLSLELSLSLSLSLSFESFLYFFLENSLTSENFLEFRLGIGFRGIPTEACEHISDK